jgi:hypothetical protein
MRAGIDDVDVDLDYGFAARGQSWGRCSGGALRLARRDACGHACARDIYSQARLAN